MATYHYGGQALIEGVLMRGRNVLAVALRHPDGSIVWAAERLDLGLRARRAMKLPFLRGLVVLYDTLVTGTRWLVRSATVQALDEGGARPGARGGAAGAAGGLLQTIALLFAVPALCAAGDDAAHRTAAGAAEDGAPKKASDTRRAAPDSTETANALDQSSAAASTDVSAYSNPDLEASTSRATAEQGMGKGYTVAVGGMLLLSLGRRHRLLLPAAAVPGAGHRRAVRSGLGLQLAEGVIRVVDLRRLPAASLVGRRMCAARSSTTAPST